jgi:hypothetical protein
LKEDNLVNSEVNASKIARNILNKTEKTKRKIDRSLSNKEPKKALVVIFRESFFSNKETSK